MKRFKKILLSLPAMFFYICVVVWAAQTTILSTDTLNEAWTKQHNMNTELYALDTMVYPGAGIPLSTGTAWGTSYSLTTLAAVLDNEAWTFTGTVDMTGATSVNLGPLVFTSTATPPAEDGKLTYLSSVTGWAENVFAYFTDKVMYLLSYDTLPTVDGSYPTYNATNDDIDWENPNSPVTSVTTTGATLELDFANSTYHVVTFNQNCAVTVTNWPATGYEGAIAIRTVNAGAYTVTICGKTAVDLDLTVSGSDLVMVWSEDGGVSAFVRNAGDDLTAVVQ